MADRSAARASKRDARASDAPRRARGPLAELAIGAGWLVGIAVALQVVDLVLGRSPLPSALAGALVVDLAASRAGVRWEQGDPGTLAEGRTRRIAERIGVGAACAALVVAASILIGVTLGWARVRGGQVSTGIALALVRAAALAVRDELLLRGVVFAVAARARLPVLAAVAFASVTGAASIAALPSTGPAAIALAASSGALFAVLWTRQRGAYGAIAAHALWLILSGPALRGGLLDVAWSAGLFSAGSRASGPPAWLASALFLATAFVVWRRSQPRTT